MLGYKAKFVGVSVVLVDPRYTSQTGPMCGHASRANRFASCLRFQCHFGSKVEPDYDADHLDISGDDTFSFNVIHKR
ncbi:MAG: zinc ribbon domain-containing protein [Methanotrichaceae archaeon]